MLKIKSIKSHYRQEYVRFIGKAKQDVLTINSFDEPDGPRLKKDVSW